jgi:hypothetical protein
MVAGAASVRRQAGSLDALQEHADREERAGSHHRAPGERRGDISRRQRRSSRAGRRVLEVLSVHLCHGWLEGSLLTGRHQDPGFIDMHRSPPTAPW